jgi:hypothetical protein
MCNNEKTPRTKEADLKMGNEKEDTIIAVLRRYFNDETIENTKKLYNDKFCKWDFESKNGWKWEHKSRRIKKDQYDTAFMPVHKVVESEHLYYCWTYLDGYFFIEYEEALFNTFNKRLLKIWRDGKYDPPQWVFEIPVNLLKKFD